jgi:hypothetical protein
VPGAVVSYAGLNVLGAAEASSDNINVVPGDVSLDFDSSSFSGGSNSLLSTGAQAEVVHFAVDSSFPILSTNFVLHGPVETAAAILVAL